MNFSEQLNKYISLLGCSAKELSESSSISATVISRYKNNQRTPKKNSELLQKLSNGIVSLAEKNNMPNIKYGEIYSSLNDTLKEKDSVNFEHLSNNFNKLLSICNINMADMARSLSVDPSYLSRIRNNQRKPVDIETFINSVCNYIVRRYNTDSSKKIISDLIGCEFKDLLNQTNYLLKLKTWICSETSKSHSYVDDFLKKLDSFNLDEYIRTIHFDELKVPSVPFQLPTSKSYYGIEEMKKGELDFFKATILSKSKDSVFMYSDMPMEDMAKDVDFAKKWMFAIAMTLKKGLHLDIIHNLERPFNEMMLGLESWIPIYMSGQISPYYIKGVQNNIYNHLNYVSGNVALSGECINGSHDKGKYYLTNSKEELTYCRKKTDLLLQKASPLMEIYLKNSSNVYDAFINSNSKTIGNRRRILSSLPMFTMPESILFKILKRNSVSDIDKDNILKFIEQQKGLIKNITECNTILDEIPEFSKEEFEKYPIFLSLSNMFYEKKLQYTYEEYEEHFELTKQHSKINKNYIVQSNTQNAFRNIQIFIHEGKWVIISKESSPTIHFVIHHPKLCNAIQNFVVPIVE